MTNLIKILFLFYVLGANAQPNTDVYIMNVIFSEGLLHVSNFKNISNDPGYDSQPSFLDNDLVLFAGNNNGQTDIAQYNLLDSKKKFINKPTSGGEYSPQMIPNTPDIAAVRLDTTGKQRLYRYSITQQSSEELIPEIEVAYFAFYDQNTILSSVLSNDRLDLALIDLQKKTTYTILQNSGRSIHKIPGKDAMSYTAVNEEGNMDIYQFDMKDHESYFICQLPIGIQDHIWLDESRLLLGSGSQLFVYDLFGKGKWEAIANLKDEGITNISRLAISPDKKSLAIVAESHQTDPGTIVQRHIEPFNNRNLDAFADCFSEEVVVSRFPEEAMYVGKASLKKNYANFYNKTPEVSVEVINRIVNGNTVIDEEKVTIGGKIKKQATVYEVENDKIKSMTFIANRKVSKSPEGIVQKQLDAYNKRDLASFMATYAEDISLYNFPNATRTKGKFLMREGYEAFFRNAPDLHCKILKRIVIGNKVIDHEEVSANGSTFVAVAIYEVNDGLITTVTFL